MAVRGTVLKHEIAHIVLTLRFEEEAGQWVGTCDELGTSTFAPSLDKVQEELHELVTLHLNGLEEIGERERFFGEHGIVIHWAKPSEKVRVMFDWDPTRFGQRAPLFQPHLFPFPNPSEAELVMAGG